MSLWICYDCGKKYGKSRTLVSTYHTGKCEYCREVKAVTESRDWGYPKLPEERMHENKRDN